MIRIGLRHDFGRSASVTVVSPCLSSRMNSAVTCPSALDGSGTMRRQTLVKCFSPGQDAKQPSAVRALCQRTAIGNRGRQACSIPVVVQADTDDVALEVGGGAGIHDGGATSSDEGTDARHEWSVGKGHAAQVVIEILDLRAPPRRKQPFRASAGRPSDPRLRNCTGCRCGGLEAVAGGEGTVVVGLTDRRAGLDATIGETARAICKESRAEQIAEPPAKRAEIVELLAWS